MFTGLVETIGILRQRAGSPVARAFIECSLGPLELGESISVNGACLTVDRIRPTGFECDMSSETLDRTTLGALAVGARVHLERAMKLGGRMGGHMVLGHVDGIGRVSERSPSGDATRLVVETDGALAPYLADKGSVAIDGVSLTINRVKDQGQGRSSRVLFEVMLVPHTLGRTNLGDLRPGQAVNLEVDVLARYVARQLSIASGVRATSSSDEAPGWGGEVAENDEHHHHESRDERLLAKLRSGGFL
ncbi:riboflavin synthase [Polyangium sp. y55x31]|uniref:riboflavin synthase n=1 Tax=Polyangium sp. y55x31 TaxID=3042688 RepID=UPI00248250DB|nr:riboflavin synthase [Polyangium sp. y55x31]MDI1481886.1 riboflavin synthase [Polyangium sp. y55x31]